MSNVIPPDQIRLGMRVMVISPADKDCDHAILWGVGVVTYTAQRTEVVFDNGSGGMFPNSTIYLEPRSWAEVATHLRLMGWTVDRRPLFGVSSDFLWRSPDGISGSDYRSGSPDAPPDAVMQHAARRGDIHFTHLSPAAV